MRTRVKICGITRLDDALVAVNEGADALGFVFYAPSPRNISPAQAAEIIAALPPFVTTVGLFVNATPDEVNDVLAQVELNCLQFHGDESADFCELFAKPYIRAIRVRENTDIEQAALEYSNARALLLDTYVENVPGGTGQTFNWSRVPENCTKPLILAGGLTVDNIADAISQTHPYAVDVSGGVESEKGIKDHGKIQTFIKEVNRVGTG